MLLPQFKLEEYFAKYEFVAPFMMGSSDPETHTLPELVSMADKECLLLWNNLKLNYTETHGLPLLREEISKLYDTQNKDNILIFSGAEEAIYIAMQIMLESDDHVVVLTPCYQSLKAIPKSIGANVTEFPLEWKNNNWFFNLEKFSTIITDKTKLVILNFPHYPTGFQPSKEVFKSIINIIKQYDIYLFSPELSFHFEMAPQSNSSIRSDRAFSMNDFTNPGPIWSPWPICIEKSS